jgi:hypothetical protein
MTEEIGTASIETVTGFFCGIGVETESALADGRFNIPADLFRYVDDLLKLPGVVKALSKIPAEFEDLTEDERESIIEFIQEKLNLPQSDVKAVAVAAFKMVLSTSQVYAAGKELVAAIKALKHPELV